MIPLKKIDVIARLDGWKKTKSTGIVTDGYSKNGNFVMPIQLTHYLYSRDSMLDVLRKQNKTVQKLFIQFLTGSTAHILNVEREVIPRVLLATPEEFIDALIEAVQTYDSSGKNQNLS